MTTKRPFFTDLGLGLAWEKEAVNVTMLCEAGEQVLRACSIYIKLHVKWAAISMQPRRSSSSRKSDHKETSTNSMEVLWETSLLVQPCTG
jgi:hypothetical protein